MCEPTTIALVAGMAITAAAGYVEYRNTKKAGEANAQIAENNARLAEAGAKDAAILSAREQQQAAWRTRAVIGRQKAAMAANMIDSGEGTAFDLLGESALFGGAEQSALSQDAARKAWGFQSEALNYRNQGRLAKWEANAAAKVTALRTIGSLVSMGSGFAGAGRGAATSAGTSSSMSYSSAYPSYTRGLGTGPY